MWRFTRLLLLFHGIPVDVLCKWDQIGLGKGLATLPTYLASHRVEAYKKPRERGPPICLGYLWRVLLKVTLSLGKNAYHDVNVCQCTLAWRSLLTLANTFFWCDASKYRCVVINQWKHSLAGVLKVTDILNWSLALFITSGLECRLTELSHNRVIVMLMDIIWQWLWKCRTETERNGMASTTTVNAIITHTHWY